MRINKFTLFMCTVLWTIQAKSADLYVTTTSQLASACSTAANGDVINIGAGTYTGPFVINGKSNITLKSYNGTVYMQGSSSASTNGVIILEIYNSNGISVQNLVFRNNWGNYADGVKVHGYGSGTSISGCEFYNIGWTTGKTTMPSPTHSAHAIIAVGSSATSISNLFIGNNNIHDCITGYSESVTVVGNVEQFLIEGNTLNSNTNIGIDAAGFFSWTGAPANVNYARSGVIRKNVVSNYAGPTGLDAAGGIYTDGGSYITIENNTVFNYKVGFSIGCEVAGNNNYGNILRNNLAYNCSLSGLFLGSNTSSMVNNTSVYNNTFYKCATSTYDNGQIALQNNSGSIIKNNIIYPTNGRYAMVQMGGTTSSSKTQAYNLYWRDNGTTSTLFYNITGDANAVLQNPLFINAAASNFHVSDSSPAVNAGDPSYNGSGQVDMDDAARIQGGRVDIGTDETGTSATATITIDGNTSDWSSRPSISTSGTGGPTGLKAADNSQYLYILVTGTINTNYEIFIDTDNSTSAGSNEYLGTDWPSTGFDFMVENGTLYAHNGQGSGWTWNSLGAVSVVKSGSVVEMAISKSSLGTLTSTIRIAAKMISSSWVATGYIPLTGGAASPYTIGSSAARFGKTSNALLSSSALEMSVYPNPTQGTFNLNFKLEVASKIEVVIVDISGRAQENLHVENMSLGDHSLTLKCRDNLKPGIYIIRVMQSGHSIYNKPIILE